MIFRERREKAVIVESMFDSDCLGFVCADMMTVIYLMQGCRDLENIGEGSKIFSEFFQKFCINRWNFQKFSEFEEQKNEIFDYWGRGGSPTCTSPPPARDTPDLMEYHGFCSRL